MNDEVTAIVLGLIVAFAVRFLNVVLEFVSRVLKVDPPTAIDTPGSHKVQTLPGSTQHSDP